LRRQSASSRSDPPTAQGLDRQNNRERADHPEEVQDPHEEQGATLVEKLWAQAIPHVQWHHREGYHAAKQHDHLTRSPFSQQHGAANQDEQDRDADKLVQSAAVEAEDDVLGDVQRKEDYGEDRGRGQEIAVLHGGAPCYPLTHRVTRIAMRGQSSIQVCLANLNL